MTDESPPSNQATSSPRPPSGRWGTAIVVWLLMLLAGGAVGYLVLPDQLDSDDENTTADAATTAPPASTTPADEETQLAVHDTGEIRFLAPAGWKLETDSSGVTGTPLIWADAPGGTEDRFSSDRVFVNVRPAWAPQSPEQVLDGTSPRDECDPPVREPYSHAAFSGLVDRYQNCNGDAGIEYRRIAVSAADGAVIYVGGTVIDKDTPAVFDRAVETVTYSIPEVAAVNSTECSQRDLSEEVSFTAVNDRDHPVQLIWHSSDCEPSIPPFARIAAGKSVTRDGRIGEKWSLAGYDGAVLLTFDVTGPDQTFTLEP